MSLTDLRPTANASISKTTSVLLVIIAVLVAGLMTTSYMLQTSRNIPSASTTKLGPGTDFQTFTFTTQDSKTPWAFVSNDISNPTIKVKLGSTVQIIVNNTGTAPHDWALDETSPSPYRVSTEEVRPGESGAIIFIADQAGAFTYHCATPGHRDLGMQGQIIIEG